MSTTDNKNVRFCDNNFAELTTGQIEFSSELAAFPQSNAQNKFRSKVWKPSGYFRIVSGSTDSDGVAPNDKIYINDGSDKTISISAGNYANPDALATEIQTQLNSASTGWTVSYNAVAGNYKFRFSHASSHVLRLSQPTDAIWNTIGFTQSTDQIISTNIDADEQRNHSFEFVIYDFGYNHPIEFLGIIGPLDEVFSLSLDATIKIQANNLNQWSNPPLDISLTRSDGGLLRFFDDIADSSFRFWRFYFEDKKNVLGPEGFSFGYIYIGDYTNILTRNIQQGFSKQFIDPSIVTISENGALYFDQKTKYSSFSGLELAFIDKDARDKMESLFYQFGKTTPFFVSFDPRLEISNELFDLTKYVVFETEPQFNHVIRDLFSMSLQFREVL